MNYTKKLIFSLVIVSIFSTLSYFNTYAGNVAVQEMKKQAEIDAVTGPATGIANNEAALNKKEEQQPAKPKRGALIGKFKITAYTREEFPDNQTSTGIIPMPRHSIASDWKILPAGTKVMIGENDDTIYVVEDSGVKGKHIDIFMETNKEAKIFGVQHLNIYSVIE